MHIQDLYHKVFNIPYTLHVASDNKKGIHTIVFLHGIASDSETWKQVLPLLEASYRCITIDLLGFGQSPKPSWPNYNLKYHTKSVLHTLNKLNLNEPVTLVGHSMGGLISIEIAYSHPNKVSHLVICGAPLYELNEIENEVKSYKKSKSRITNVLFYIYEELIEDKKFTLSAAKKIMYLSEQFNNFTLSEASWIPFQKSLKNSIMQQDSLQKIQKLTIPISVINGMIDLLIINKHYVKLNRNKANITTLSTVGGHAVTKSTAKKIKLAITNQQNQVKKDIQ